MLELARPDDRENVNALALDLHTQHVTWRPDIFEAVEEVYSSERFEEAIRQRSLYVAKLNDVVVGYAAVSYQNYSQTGLTCRKAMVLEELCVLESCRSQGIGQQMVLELRALSRAFRCTDLQLGVYPQNDDAVGFFQKCGFMIQSITMQMKA